MYAVFVHLDLNSLSSLKNNGPCVYTFYTEQAAVEWMIEKLIEAGELVLLTNGGFEITVSSVKVLSPILGLTEWQGMIESSEYFHLYPVIPPDES